MPRALLLTSLAASALYASTFVFGAFPGSWVVKAMSVTALGVLALRTPLLAAGLLLGSIGDALLDLSPDYFVFGLIAFLFGHVCYALCFWRDGRRTPGPVPQAAVVLFAALFMSWLWPGLGSLRIPAVCYFAAITSMTVASFRVGGWVAVGALLFLGSDALLATNRFRLEIPVRDWLVWFTYYGGQLGIALGFLRSRSAGLQKTYARSNAEGRP